MKILLVIPYNRSYVVMPSLGLGYLASVARQQGHEVGLLHCIRDRITPEEFRRRVTGAGYELIGFQMMTYDLNHLRQHLEEIALLKPRPVTLIGGYHPSGDPEGVLLQLPLADYALQGEAENAFPLFLDFLSRRSRESPEQVPNLIWRQRERIRINPPAWPERLDDLPLPAWDLMDPRTYPPAPHGAFALRFPTAPIIITRGCPCSCTFCGGRMVTGGRLRERSVPNVMTEIDLLQERYGVSEFLIEDENFTLRRSLVEGFCSALSTRPRPISWSCPSGVRLDTLHRETLDLMHGSGCHSLSVGIEFGTQKLLDLTRKKISLQDIRDKLALLRATPIRVTGFFLLGYPGETEEDIRATIHFSRSLDLDRVQYNNFMPLPGSPIYRDLVAAGKLSRATLETDRFFVHDVGYVPEGLTRKIIKRLQRHAYLGFYLRPRILWRLLRDIRGIRHLLYLGWRFLDGLK